MVHRPKYDDWSLPKGKLDRGETHEAAALREVEEETGFRCVLGPELPSAHYDVRGRPKRVRYWSMSVSDGEFTPNREVDEVRWLPPAEAARILTRPGDAQVVEGLPVSRS